MRLLLLKDLFDIYPEKEKIHMENIIIKEFSHINNSYEIIRLGEVINQINYKNNNININFLDNSDLMVHFKENKKDKTVLIRVALVCIILFLGAAMAIINFHADVDMKKSHATLLRIITGKDNKNLLFLQIPYSLGIGIGVAVFYNKLIPNYSKSEPSPLELEVDTFRKEIEKYMINNPKNS